MNHKIVIFGVLILEKEKNYREDATFSFSENESQNNLATCGC